MLTSTTRTPPSFLVKLNPRIIFTGVLLMNLYVSHFTIPRQYLNLHIKLPIRGKSRSYAIHKPIYFIRAHFILVTILTTIHHKTRIYSLFNLAGLKPSLEALMNFRTIANAALTLWREYHRRACSSWWRPWAWSCPAGASRRSPPVDTAFGRDQLRRIRRGSGHWSRASGRTCLPSIPIYGSSSHFSAFYITETHFVFAFRETIRCSFVVVNGMKNYSYYFGETC